jgi:hypothetical protein
MRKSFWFALAGVAALALPVSDASAQAGSPLCRQLEGQLAALSNPAAGNDQFARLQAAEARQRYDLDRAVAASRSMGCKRTFIFTSGPPQCRDLEARVKQMRANLDAIQNQMQRAQGGVQAQRQQVLAALSQNRCGPQYQAAAPRQQQRQSGGLFDMLFGRRPQQEPLQQQPQITAPMPTSTYRTVCVRTCDGFFFPLSFSTTQENFARDADRCQRTCPGTQAEMFAYPNPGGDMDQAVSINGEAYTSLANAFLYQKQFVKGCSCKPAGESWAQALKDADSGNAQSGDILVDEARSRAMAQPKGGNAPQSATPAEAARAAQDAAQSQTSDGVQETPLVSEPDSIDLPPDLGPDDGQGGAVYAPPR